MVKAKRESSGARHRRQPRRDTLELLARNVRVLRAQHRYSQEYLADEAGVNRTYIGDLERCEHNPTLATLEVLADALGVRIADLLLPPPTLGRKRKS